MLPNEVYDTTYLLNIVFMIFVFDTDLLLLVQTQQYNKQNESLRTLLSLLAYHWGLGMTAGEGLCLNRDSTKNVYNITI